MSEKNEKVRLERDALSERRALAALAATAALVVLGILIPWGLLRAFEAQLGRPSPDVGVEARPPELLHEPMSIDRPAERDLARDEAVLASFSWVDRERGTVRIPIDRAMELVVARARARGGR